MKDLQLHPPAPAHDDDRGVRPARPTPARGTSAAARRGGDAGGARAGAGDGRGEESFARLLQGKGEAAARRGKRTPRETTALGAINSTLGASAAAAATVAALVPPPASAARASRGDDDARAARAAGVQTAAPQLSALAPAPRPEAPPPASAPAATLATLASYGDHDPSLRGRLAGAEARLSLRTDGGELTMQLHVRDRVADVRLTGHSTAALANHVHALQAHLAAQGLTLGTVTMAPAAAAAASEGARFAPAPTEGSAGAGQRDDDNDEDDHDHPDRRVHVTA